ncbi:MAG TPA: hypothetical protein VJ483_00455, partial [Holophagaceae bacterium]|nr:hypothetical protein [Holophagaceae bacterium]
FIYTLTPLSTSALFTAAALARVRALRTVPPFFFGKAVSDAMMIFTGRYAIENLERSAFSTHGVVVLVLGVAIIAAFLFVDWRRLLEQKQFRFNIHIWK